MFFLELKKAVGARANRHDFALLFFASFLKIFREILILLSFFNKFTLEKCDFRQPASTAFTVLQLLCHFDFFVSEKTNKFTLFSRNESFKFVTRKFDILYANPQICILQGIRIYTVIFGDPLGSLVGDKIIYFPRLFVV